MSTPLKTSVVIPVYNEGKLIILTLKNIIHSLKKNYEILICYDFDEDDTLEVTRDQFNHYITNQTIRLIKNKSNGPHAAVMQGILKSKGCYIIVIPADDSVNSKKLHKLVNIAEQGFDIVCPSRFIKGGMMKGAPFLKSFINRFVNTTLKTLGMPTADATNGFRLFSKKVVKSIEINSSQGFIYSIEYLIKAYDRNFRIAEFPSLWIERNKGKSKFNLGKWCFPYLKYFIYGVYICLKKGLRFG